MTTNTEPVIAKTYMDASGVAICELAEPFMTRERFTGKPLEIIEYTAWSSFYLYAHGYKFRKDGQAISRLYKSLDVEIPENVRIELMKVREEV